MENPLSCRHVSIHCAVLLVLAIAVIVCETSGNRAGVVGTGHRGSSHHRHHGFAPSYPRPTRRPIDRPAECRHHDKIFEDCFLCGKLAEELFIYRQCCHRDADIVDFCTRLLE